MAALTWGATTAIAVLVGASTALSLGLGGLVWSGMVLRRWRTPPRWSRPAPWRLAEPWRRYVVDALAAERRFRDLVHGTSPGPLEETLRAMQPRVVAAARETWAVALLGAALGDEFRRLARHRGGGGRARGELPESGMAAADEARDVVLEGARSVADRLRLLEARFGEAIARTAELSVSSADVVGSADSLEDLIGELRALRSALQEVDRIDRRASGDLDPRA